MYELSLARRGNVAKIAVALTNSNPKRGPFMYIPAVRAELCLGSQHLFPAFVRGVSSFLALGPLRLLAFLLLRWHATTVTKKQATNSILPVGHSGDSMVRGLLWQTTTLQP